MSTSRDVERLSQPLFGDLLPAVVEKKHKRVRKKAWLALLPCRNRCIDERSLAGHRSGGGVEFFAGIQG
jgi:hypothetical protein